MQTNNNMNINPYVAPNVLAQPPKPEAQKPPEEQIQEKMPFNPLLSKYIIKQNSQILPTINVNKVEQSTTAQNSNYKNDLKDMLMNNQANIIGVIPRVMNAQDTDGNGLIQNGEISGNFINAIDRLDELKAMGINTLHVLPVHPTGKTKAMGTAGSLYSPDEFVTKDGKLAVDPNLKDPNVEGTAHDHFKKFIDEAHKRGMKIMLDLPSCASYAFAQRYPHMMAKEANGEDKTPQGWQDIRMFKVWNDEAKRELNPDVLDLHKQYVEACIDLGIDGIRADVSRAKPTEFWNVIIPYSQTIDPQFGWLAESYTYEDASPQLNMPFDRPEDQLRAGFDSYYGQFHITHSMTADQIFDYMQDNIEMSNRADSPKSLLGSMTTHDDPSPMYFGGAPWVMFTTALQTMLPMVNTYFFDGVQSGDYYLYPYDHAHSPTTQTDNSECTVHTGRPDIFNYSRKPGGNNPEIGEFIKGALAIKNGDIKPEYKDIINHGSFIKLEDDNKDIMAFARHKDGKTLLFVANRNANDRASAKIKIPGFSKNQELKNLLGSYSGESLFQKKDDKLKVELAPLRTHIFEINTPDLAALSKPENVLQQNFNQKTV